jgi:hypothetical protein
MIKMSTPARPVVITPSSPTDKFSLAALLAHHDVKQSLKAKRSLLEWRESKPDSGEDYVYPSRHFVIVEVPQAEEKKLLETGRH